MVAIKDFASNSVMGVVRKIANYLCDTLTPKVDGAIDHLPARFNGTFNDNSRVLTMTIESQGTSTENLTAEVTIPAGGGSGGPTYSAGNGINITPENAIEIDTSVTATKQSVDTLQAQVGDAFTEVAIGADGKSLDFTALDGQVNNIILPSSGDSEWLSVANIAAIDITKIKIGTEILFANMNDQSSYALKYGHFSYLFNVGTDYYFIGNCTIIRDRNFIGLCNGQFKIGSSNNNFTNCTPYYEDDNSITLTPSYFYKLYVKY